MGKTGNKRTSSSPAARRALAVLLPLAAALLVPALAGAHLERPSYFPDPAPDTSIQPPAGGKVPKARSLSSAVRGKGPGEVHVVCQGPGARKSMRALRRSVRSARTRGWRDRPSQPKRKLSRKQAKRLVKRNRALARQCSFRSVQKAALAAGNNDRIVIMPGLYTEPASRKQPTNDPRCADLTQTDQQGRQTPSYRYQVSCPNDQSLIHVAGREVPEEPAPDPPLSDRKGIPDEGPCMRCNLQIEGSGVKAVDVILDAGEEYENPRRPAAKPGDYAKDVVLRVDRADGFVGRNFTMRGAWEHGFYTEETDGILLDRVKFLWNADYGHLSFVTDHHVVQNCDGFGAGDAVVYPGAAPETGEQADTSFWPDAPRPNTTIRKCDLRGSTLGYSGSMGNSTRVTRNHVYGNALGIVTDTISAAGHPGYPADSMEIDNNLIYSNNLNVWSEDSPVEARVGILPVGTGILYAGHNNGRIHDNWIFDNWRRGAMLTAVPDQLVEPEGDVENRDRISCQTAMLPVPLTNSCGNRYFDNTMGQAPPDFTPGAVDQFGAPHGSGAVQPNGVDFWWDEFATNSGNCWFDNTGSDGTPEGVTEGGGAPPDSLPADCGASVGLGDAVKQVELLNCFLAREEDLDPFGCTWDEVPPQPASAAARRAQRQFERDVAAYMRSDEARKAVERDEALLERAAGGR